ncbi:MAG: RHS repeat-associated core domain-containing protein [Nitrospirae bacterium]|nr:RHS repeat-associated core domain-containing protein [Nitrospirota bacterium]
MTYDDNGNMKTVTNTCGTTTYTWDARDRLTAINGFTPTCFSLTASFKYDALGRRYEKTINGVTTQYVYDGMDIIQEKQNGTVTANYIRSLNIDEPLVRIKADETIRHYKTDGLGSVIQLVDDTGVVQTTYTYDPFGNVTVSGEVSDNPFQYTGRENDGTGLYYYRFRYYSPELQRFISEDPIGLAGGDVNYVAYVGNNPVNLVDPLGLEWVNPVSYWRNLYRYARENRTWGHQQYPGEENSSMRHCVVSCMVASNFGTAGARAAGVGNEVQGLVLHDIPDIRGRISGERPWAFQWQDLKDNERGFQAAKKNCSNMSESDTRQSCIQRCQGQ